MSRSILFAALAALALAASASAQTQTRARDAGGSLSAAPIQGQHVRTMIVSCKPEDTIKFYRDVLGMKVLSDDGGKPVQVGQLIVDMPDTGLLRMVVFGGTGEYPAGPVIGSRIGMLGLMDPASPACKDAAKGNRRTPHGGVIMPIRVSNMPEILKRAKAMGIEVIKEGPSPSRLTWQTLLYDPNGIVLELFELNVTPIP
jgi:catechol 2,3-dioxygenase-like lactoylglutathione lyase family enzyme